MKILMLLDNEFTGDLRVENEVKSLQKNGFSVTVLCLNYGNKNEREEYHGAEIVRLPIKKWYHKKIKALVTTWFDVNTSFWVKHTKRELQRKQYDVIHIHDLLLMPVAIQTVKENPQFKIVADLHENYPYALQGYKYTNKFPGNVVFSLERWLKKEKEWLKEADEIITVIEEAVERYQKLGLRTDITVVPNYVNIEEFLGSNSVNPQDNKNGKTIATYIGGIDIHRGLESVIRAIPLVLEKQKDFEFWLIGSGTSLADLKVLVDELGIRDTVKFWGWQQPTTLPQFISDSDICLIPHLKSEQTDNTIPHKMFQYMLMGKPLLVSNCDPLKRIVQESGSGCVHEAGNPVDIARKLESMIRDEQARENMGKNGQNAAREKYNWEESEKNLVRVYQKLQKEDT